VLFGYRQNCPKLPGAKSHQVLVLSHIGLHSYNIQVARIHVLGYLVDPLGKLRPHAERDVVVDVRVGRDDVAVVDE